MLMVSWHLAIRKYHELLAAYFFTLHIGKFIEPDKKKRSSVHCKLCPKVLKYSGNTANLHYHLELNHHTQFLLLQTKEKEKDQSSTSTQKSVKDLFVQATPLPTSSTRWNHLTESLCYFIAKDMQPIDTIDDKGFRKMLQQFEPRYTPPDCKTVSTKYLPQMFQTEKDCVKLTRFLSMHALQICGPRGHSIRILA